MERRKFIQNTGYAGLGISLFSTKGMLHAATQTDTISIGMIGLDTSHCTAFTKILNTEDTDPEVKGFQVTHAYPYGSKTIESSYSRIPKYTAEMTKMGVEISDSIASLLKEVDVVLLETNDGRLHLEQAWQVIEAGKPMFIDKPIAASLSDAIKIFELAKQYDVPIFSASSLRFGPATQAVANGKIGKVLGANMYSPAKIESTHPDLFWYGVHGVESLFTVMGTGCKEVRRLYSEEVDVVIGEWEDGRVGTFRGIREGKQDYGGTAFGTEGIAEAGHYEGYRPLVVEIGKFFHSRIAPVAPEETLEIFAFMQAAEESKKQGGRPVSLASVMESAKH